MMDDESVGEILCIVNRSDSEKSIATTNAESQEWESSGQESLRTYVLAADSDNSRAARYRASPPPAVPYDAISLRSATNVSQKLSQLTDVAVTEEAYADASDAPAPDNNSEDAVREYSLFARETFTQTSKTILELAQTNYMECYTDTNAIETQTSRVSIVKNKIIEYKIEVTGSQTRFTRNEIPVRVGSHAGADGHARPALPEPGHSRDNSDDYYTLRIIDDDDSTSSGDAEHSDVSDDNTSKNDTDFTDSLEEDRAEPGDRYISDGSVPKSVDRDVAELYTKLEKSFDLRSFGRPAFEITRYVALSPLKEETNVRDSLASWRASARTLPKESSHKKILTTSDVRIDELSIEGESKDQWSLPPISQHGHGHAGSPRRRPYSLAPRALLAPRPRAVGRAYARTSAWAAGENAQLATRSGMVASNDRQRLPPITAATMRAPAPAPASRGDGALAAAAAPKPRARSPDTISIGGKIQQLKMPPPEKRLTVYPASSTESRSPSPQSPGSPSERCWGAAGADVAARGCEALCADVIARLRQACSCARITFEQLVSRHDSSDSCGAKWAAAVEVLEDIPRLFRGCWASMPEHRVADLLRLATAQVESPRTRVARAACSALAALLSHTNYTKKPDFDEAVSALLGKTGSMASTLRRVANLALDQVVAATATAPAVTSLCIFGAEHKSALVRCAAARLLVVAAALAAGGRGLLRARPRSVADARRHALRALAALLDDRSQDTRKYAERLYALLRPQPGFKAFFLADVDARTACRLMKKLDPLLAPSPSPPAPPR